MQFRNFHNERVKRYVDIDNVDLEISSFWLHEACFQKNYWETKKPELKQHITNATNETF